MLKDKVRYGVSENVVIGAEISAPQKEYKASALDYKQLNELIIEACSLEDPSFLYLVVMSMTQGLRREKQRLEKAKEERLKGKPPEDILIEYQ